MDLEDQLCLYMNVEECRMVGFAAGHGVISKGQAGRTLLSLYDIRQSFGSIVQYRGPDYPEPPEFRRSIGTFVIHLLEVKFREIYNRNCKAIKDPSCSRLGQDFVNQLIVNWSQLSEESMKGIVDPNYEVNSKGIEELSNLWDILDGIFYLHIDGFNKGHFLHVPLSPPPRSLTWSPIDPGEGDIDTPLQAEKVVSCSPANMERKPKQSGNVNHKKKRLAGGGAGSLPVVPEWFLDWEQQDNVSCLFIVV